MTAHTTPTLLIDRTNIDRFGDLIRDAVSKANFIGFDYETQDDARHEGLNKFCGYDANTRKKSKGKPLVFDMRRTTVCGASFYPQGHQLAYYLNLGHADVENRLTREEFLSIIGAKRDGAFWVAHNAPFEIAVSKGALDFDLTGTLCTLQMAVSAYGPDTYDKEVWRSIGQGTIAELVPELKIASVTGLLDDKAMEMTPELSELVYKIIAKESSASFSYNGMIKEIAYGYGLKQAVARHFGYQMKTFEQTLGEKAHMGQLTGAETAAYGAEDAYWAVRLFEHLLAFMLQNGGERVFRTFLEQENPMTKVFADCKLGGLRVNSSAIDDQHLVERKNTAVLLRQLRKHVKALLPFPDEPNERLLKYEKWYVNGWSKYRQNIIKWVAAGDKADDFEELSLAAGAVSNEWREERGLKKSTGPNFMHYMPVRTLIYDLLQQKPFIEKGKVQGDGETRGKLLIRLGKTDDTPRRADSIGVINSINALTAIDQRVKLYITPYRQLIDPETNCMYPTISSMLATRRMAGQQPNGMQLAKRGESVFVRGYFLPDNDQHVTVSIDWSAIELVEIGEFSGDTTFCKAFGSIPHEDLHAGSAAAILAVAVPGLTESSFKDLRRFPNEHGKWGDYADHISIPLEKLTRLATNLKGEQLTPPEAYKYWRTSVGKGANFGFWYSGWLATIGEWMGWSQDQTAEAVRAYKERFPEAEQWRVELIEEVQRNGFVTLPDGHRYVRYEATQEWAIDWITKFCENDPNLLAYDKVMRFIGSKIAKRAGNQTVNAYIQGSCATIAKRSILRINEQLIKPTKGLARFVQPIHDELVFSVHRDIAPEFIINARNVMITHPDLFQKCKLDASPSVGLTFAPWDPKKAPLGQVELFEPPAEIVGSEREGKRLDVSGYKEVVDWLFERRANR